MKSKKVVQVVFFVIGAILSLTTSVSNHENIISTIISAIATGGIVMYSFMAISVVNALYHTDLVD